MAAAQDIRNQISSIQKMQKLTKAMELVAASKMRKTQNRMIASYPYANNMRKVISNMASGNLEYKHAYFEVRDVRKIGYLVITTDRGLCGGINNNLFKKLLIDIKIWSSKSVPCDLAIIGSKGLSFLNYFGNRIVAQTTGLTETPSLLEIIGVLKILLQSYQNRQLDRIYVVYNKFINIISQIPKIVLLLPLSLPEEKREKKWDYLYEPDSNFLLDTLLQRYIESQVYQLVIENLASEQASRIVAMKTATDNGGSLIQKLQIIYNKKRQASITQEITEIVSGAAAI
ncbi:MAG: F0F1 ATP synthase subunit gamma [Candidatus Dasytiphilus stammeri]